MRFRDMEKIDQAAVRESVREWMAGHPDGTITEMTEALKGQYGEHAGDMAVVLRGYAGYFLDHPEELDAGEDGQAGMPGGGRGAQAEPAGRPADERSR